MTPATADRRWLSLGVSLGVLLVALFVAIRAGEHQSIGPLDLDTEDRLAMVLWVAPPIAGGLAVRGCANRGLLGAALA
jgi:hypothetical protein